MRLGLPVLRGLRSGTNIREQFENSDNVVYAGLGAALAGGLMLGTNTDVSVAGGLESAVGAGGIGAVGGGALRSLHRALRTNEGLGEAARNAWSAGVLRGAVIAPAAYLTIGYLGQRI